MSDLISRQEAIDALFELYEYHRYIDPTEAADLVRQGIYLAEKKIEQLPSAQPEIVRCKECKYWMPHSQLGYDEDNETYHDYCGKLIPEDDYYAFCRDADDYCSRAERKTDD